LADPFAITIAGFGTDVGGATVQISLIVSATLLVAVTATEILHTF
jgi:hypothetical protein